MIALRPDSPLRAKLLERINRQYERFLDRGFPLVDYPGETIQCRNELDRTNWFELRDICRQAVADEAAFYEAMELPQPEVAGDFEIPAPGIRCTSNAYIRPTVRETLLILGDLRLWVMAAQANWWRLKDLRLDVATVRELNAMDLEEGWP